MLNLFCTSSIQVGEVYWRDFMRYTFSVVLCQNTCKPICFKLGRILGTTKLYSLTPVWVTLMFIQGHRVRGKLALVQSFCCKDAWSSWNAHGGWLCKEDNCEEALNGKYGSLKHLLFLFNICCGLCGKGLWFCGWFHQCSPEMLC